jgi:hypothetical protein
MYPWCNGHLRYGCDKVVQLRWIVHWHTQIATDKLYDTDCTNRKLFILIFRFILNRVAIRSVQFWQTQSTLRLKSCITFNSNTDRINRLALMLSMKSIAISSIIWQGGIHSTNKKALTVMKSAIQSAARYLTGASRTTQLRILIKPIVLLFDQTSNCWKLQTKHRLLYQQLESLHVLSIRKTTAEINKFTAEISAHYIPHCILSIVKQTWCTFYSVH